MYDIGLVDVGMTILLYVHVYTKDFTCSLVVIFSHALDGLGEICIKIEETLALLGEPFDLCLCSYIDPLSTSI